MAKRSGIMLCYPFEEKRLAKWKPPYIVQPKLDGDRCSITTFQNGNFMLFSSEENPFYSVPHIYEQLEKSGLSKLPLDGELYSHKLHQEGGHELIHSICSRTVNLHPIYKEMEFHIFDLKYHKLPQHQRILELQEVASNFGPNIKLVPMWVCETLDEIKKAYDNLVELKYEGIVVRHFFADYREKRSIWLMKFKPKEKDEYKIIDWKEETTIKGEPKGRIGSLLLSSQEGDEFSVGAGLDSHQKALLWDMRDKIAGCMATVYYQHLTNRGVPKGTFDIRIPELGIE